MITRVPTSTVHRLYGRWEQGQLVCFVEAPPGSGYSRRQLALSDIVEEGTDFVRLSPVTKSDHVEATPWSFQKIEISQPVQLATIDYNDQWMRPEVCGSDYYQRITFDAAGFRPIASSHLVGQPFSLAQREKVDSLAIVKAQANLRKAMASVPMLWKERGESLSTVGKYSRFILNNVITLQRRDVKRWLRALRRHRKNTDKLKSIARDIASGHLEFVFGVLPLIDDIMGLCEFATAEKLQFRTGRGRMTLVDEREETFPYPVDTPNQSSRTPMPGLFRKTTTHRYSVRTGLRMDIRSEVLNNASLLGFNPLYTWYDMTPLSFVVGWFSNLNHWLQSLDPILGLEFRTGFSTKRTETKVSNEWSGGEVTWYTGTNVRVGGSGASVGTGTFQQRVVHDKMPGIQPWYFVDNASFFAAAAGVSLTVQRLVKTANNEITKKQFRYRGPKPRNLPPIRYKAL